MKFVFTIRNLIKFAMNSIKYLCMENKIYRIDSYIEIKVCKKVLMGLDYFLCYYIFDCDNLDSWLLLWIPKVCL